MTISYLSAPISLRDKFTQFLLWEEKQNYIKFQWKQDPKLAYNFRKYSSILHNLDENQWFIYWLNNIEQNPLAKYHLTAYLEYNCYWVVRKFLERQNIYLNKLSDTEKYIKTFNILRDNTINTAKLLREFSKFNPSYSHIKTYSQRWLYNLIRDGIYQEYGIGKYTYWGLLKNTSKTNLQLALTNQGNSQKEIQSFLLLWQCFKEIYNANRQTQKSDKIAQPTSEIIIKIIGLYHSLIKIDSDEEYLNINGTVFPQVMDQCYQALIAYEKIKRPCAYAYNLPLQSEMEENENINKLTLEQILFQQQRKEYNNNQNGDLFSLWDKQQLNLILVNTIQNINESDPEKTKLLALYYGLGLKQTYISQLFNIRQDKISKQKGKITEKILQIFVQEINHELGNKFITCPQLNKVSKIIEVWLSQYYQKPFYTKLQKLFLNLTVSQKQLLKLAYGGDYSINKSNIGLSRKEIAIRFQQHQTEIDHQLEIIKTILQIGLVKYIKKDYNININYDHKQIINLVEKWLLELPYSMLC
ncbi:hypothetical protein [Cyanobacterium sp. Dongsha4]|uniref:hypothetical protein n=1 Tax=Cyanobacterium sp. DS4 TaxID=2878255 RepID=UPI002E805FFE|nr:hypothetical protein [Cyanobacterium sp. Dongsha4]WVL00434.1 hypothetical protein Dongsha4_17580 [Cyanobacterium sp. Dongsha4]